MFEKIYIETKINAPVEIVWSLYTKPEHIVNWNNASEDWHTPKAENDLRVGGSFLSRMETKDGSAGFDFTGTYNKVEQYELIEYTMDDGRKVAVTFAESGNETDVRVTFDAETSNSIEMQRQGWQAILDNFKSYVENQ